MTKYLILFITIIQLFIVGACKSSSDTPGTETNSAIIQVSSFLVVSERDEASDAQSLAKINALTSIKGDSTAGYVYAISLSIAETIGGSATITSVDFSFYSNGELFGTYSPDVTSVFSSTRIAGGSSVNATDQLVSGDASFPYADEVQVTINYTDDNGTAKSTTATYNGPQYEDADLIVVEGTVAVQQYPTNIVGYADIENIGTMSASEYSVVIYYYDDADELVNLMIHDETDPLAAGSTITIAEYLTTNNYDDIYTYSWRIAWTKADGTSMVKTGEGKLK